MINLHESMGPGRDRTRDPWICSQTRICCQTRYRLRYWDVRNLIKEIKIHMPWQPKPLCSMVAVLKFFKLHFLLNCIVCRIELKLFYAFVRNCLFVPCGLLSGKGLASWLLFVASHFKFVTFPLVSLVRCGT